MDSFIVISFPQNDSKWANLFPEFDPLVPVVRSKTLINDRLRLLDDSAGCHIVHPTSQRNHSIPIWRSGNHFAVEHESHLGRIKSPQPVRDVLFLPGSVGDGKPIVFRDRKNEQTLQFKPLTHDVLGFQSNDLETGALSNLYVGGNSSDSEASEFEIHHAPELCVDSPTGWINPIIVQFLLEGEELDISAKGKLAELACLLCDDKALLAAEPLRGRNLLRRVAVLQHLGEYLDIANSATDPSVIEQLIWGLDGCAGAKPFAILDSLGGTFCVEDFGCGAPRLSWTPTKETASNKLWFANYWCKKWGGVLADQNVKRTAAPAPNSPRASGWVNVGRPIPMSKRAKIAETLVEFIPILRSELPGGGAFHSVLPWLGSLLESDVHELVSTIHRGYIRWADNGRLQFHANGFLENFARELILPISDVDIELPDVQRYPKQVVRMQESLSGSGGDFIQRLMRNRMIVVHREKRVEIPACYGWWNDWYSLLFTHSHYTTVSVVASHNGFRLGEVELAANRLGSMRQELLSTAMKF